MKLYNAGLSDDDPLRYPPTVNLTTPIPVTRAGIRKLTSKFSSLVDPNSINISRLSVAQCKTVFARLGIQEPQDTPPVTWRRQQICEYIGAPGVPGVSVPIER